MQRVSARIVRAAVIAASIAVAACSQTGPAYGPPTANTAATVEMSGLNFGPATVRVRTGDSVEWRNKSSFTHSINADPVRFPDDVSIPAGAAPFDFRAGSHPAGFFATGSRLRARTNTSACRMSTSA